MNPEEKKRIERLIRILHIEYPDEHYYTLSLRLQAQTGVVLTGRRVREILEQQSNQPQTSFNHDQ